MHVTIKVQLSFHLISPKIWLMQIGTSDEQCFRFVFPSYHRTYSKANYWSSSEWLWWSLIIIINISKPSIFFITLLMPSLSCHLVYKNDISKNLYYPDTLNSQVEYFYFCLQLLVQKNVVVFARSSKYIIHLLFNTTRKNMWCIKYITCISFL